MRVSMLIDPSLHPLTADITVSSSTQMDLSEGRRYMHPLKQPRRESICSLFSNTTVNLDGRKDYEH